MLFDSYDLGPFHLRNRLVMAPMTRCRTVFHNVPNDLMAQHYAQRASAGLIYSPGPKGYTDYPTL